MADADAGGALLGWLGARVNQGGSYRRDQTIAYCRTGRTSAKAE